jgi:protein-S-isoprenylcysteine O-methyltransferase Ste14
VIQIDLTPDLYRLLLFSGLVLHKLVWEVLKRTDTPSQANNAQPAGVFKRVVKTGKTLFLIFLVIQTLFLEIFPISEDPQMLILVGGIIYIAGLTIAITGRVQLGKNWANLEDYQVLSGQHLVRNGIYRYIRHPIYTGDVLLILGLELALNSWLVLLVIPLIVVVARQTLEEEKVLQKSFPEYAEYRKNSKMFIPFIV